ncbi:hypothetical protein GOODEAATRI_014472, partial [Goodea atripinnis]
MSSECIFLSADTPSGPARSITQTHPRFQSSPSAGLWKGLFSLFSLEDLQDLKSSPVNLLTTIT